MKFFFKIIKELQNNFVFNAKMAKNQNKTRPLQQSKKANNWAADAA